MQYLSRSQRCPSHFYIRYFCRNVLPSPCNLEMSVFKTTRKLYLRCLCLHGGDLYEKLMTSFRLWASVAVLPELPTSHSRPQVKSLENGKFHFGISLWNGFILFISLSISEHFPKNYPANPTNKNPSKLKWPENERMFVGLLCTDF